MTSNYILSKVLPIASYILYLILRSRYLVGYQRLGKVIVYYIPILTKPTITITGNLANTDILTVDLTRKGLAC